MRRVQLLQQRLALFRGESGNVHAVDAFCPHMGTDLSAGTVRGEYIECFFHRWRFDGQGLCRHIPVLEQPSQTANVGLRGYPTCEKYGLVWVYAGMHPKTEVLEVPDLQGQDVMWSLGKINKNRSHHHISMINGLDAQHLHTVHNLSLKMQVESEQSATHMAFTLTGRLNGAKPMDRLMRWLFGPVYSFSMKYMQASVASLTLLRNVFFLRQQWIWPRLHMLYAYRPSCLGTSETQPIYVTLRRPGIRGWMMAKFCLMLTRQAYFFLKDEDDRIYDNVRFDTRNLLKTDVAVAQYVKYVNGLPASQWSAGP